MMFWTRRPLWQTVVLFIVLLAVLGVCGVYGILLLSLPKLDGEIYSEYLSGDVCIERDAQGIPTVKSDEIDLYGRIDIAYATGYLHAQDRFFQMDLNRRNSAGELSALFGKAALEHDKEIRMHSFRSVAKNVVMQLTEPQMALLDAYTEGVNHGLSNLGARPFEYVLLGRKPAPWVAEDSFLSVYSMYLDLTYRQAAMDKVKGFLADIAGREVTEFLSPVATRWDAPLENNYLPEPEIPDVEQVNLREFSVEQFVDLSGDIVPESFIGSNNFAVSGKLTEHGSAIVENDMHMALPVPATWYRMQFVYQDEGKKHRINGLTLPGTPFMVIGSNGSVAWAFTNSNGDWMDCVDLELIDDEHYITPHGPKPFTLRENIIEVKGEKPVIERLRYSIWGPVIKSEYDGSMKALRWTAHNPQATNGNIQLLEKAENVSQAIHIANISGIPPQNFVAGDSEGSIGWSIMGRIPNRAEIDSTYPLNGQQAVDNWQGWLPVDNYPKVLNPKGSRLWTANASVASGEDYSKIGNDGYAVGARAMQIRNSLLVKEQFSEREFLDIAVDTNAVYISAWRAVALKAIAENGSQVNENCREFAHILEGWSGHAQADDAGYRMAREFHDAVNEKVLRQLGRYFLLKAGRQQQDIEDIWLQKLSREESSVLRLLEQQPMNWLSPAYKDWNQLVLETIDEVVLKLGGAERLAQHTWGERNTASIKHPLSGVIPGIGSWLNMPAVPLDGDGWVPLMRQSSAGVSQRMIVSPGREEQGIMHIPGGQSGHPLSSFYKAGFDDWLNNKPSSFIPGETKHTLILKEK